MPEGHNFLFVTEGDEAWIFYRRSELEARTLEDSWEAYRRLIGANDDPPPSLRPGPSRLGSLEARQRQSDQPGACVPLAG